jgi:hypothetical protein
MVKPNAPVVKRPVSRPDHLPHVSVVIADWAADTVAELGAADQRAAVTGRP